MNDKQKEDIFSEIKSLNLDFEQTEIFVVQSLKTILSDSKYKCFEKSNNGEEYGNCVIKNVRNLEDFGLKMRFRLSFYRYQMQNCLRASSSPDQQAFKQCTTELRQLSQYIQNQFQQTEQK